MDEDPTHVPGVAGKKHRRFIAPWLLACPQRLPLLQATLTSFRRTDWHSAIHIRYPSSG